MKFPVLNPKITYSNFDSQHPTVYPEDNASKFTIADLISIAKPPIDYN